MIIAVLFLVGIRCSKTSKYSSFGKATDVYLNASWTA